MKPLGVLPCLLLFVLSVVPLSGQPAGRDFISGVVTGPNGPEAGVWVIAETNDLPTKYAKIVVTDDRGRYVLPELPAATYDIWVRGYGLVDSPKTRSAPGAELNLRAVKAPDERAAAQYYPAGHWFSLLQPPAREEFPGTGATGNGIAPAIKNQAQYLRLVKSGSCMACHQLGNFATRELPESFRDFPSTAAAWERRLMSGQAGGNMIGTLNTLGRERTLAMFADWTDRIVAGETPPPPRRPEGLERNVVITQWDWADPTDYLHDLVTTDRRNPTINANGPVYGALEHSADYIPVLDPVRHVASRIPLTVRDPATQPISPQMPQPSPYWGDTVLWDSKTNVHNPMIDHLGRVWLTATVRPPENPAVFRAGSEHPSAKVFPLNRASRHLGMYDPRTGKYTTIDTGFSTHHLMFAEDENHTLWTSGGGQAVGWLDVKKFDETGDELASQGWTPLVIDTNGNGRRDAYVEPNQPVDPTKDKRISAGLYAVSPAPDGSVWGSSLGYPGALIRLVPGPNPAETALVEYYELPVDANGEPIEGFSPRGMDVDRHGVAWVALASGHLASFDRRKVKGPLNGPTATGQHARDGWTFYPEPLPQMKGVTMSGSAESSYYTWVDQFDTSGLGANTPINTGNGAEGLLALKDGKWVILRVPYPLGFYTKWVDGRIDDPGAGWKGRGLWATISTRATFHQEGGKGVPSKVMKFQVRPDPLAR
jgi:streptogramin lyase